uniref:Uncharacterized protein n=1 Tax=Anguilla anguilla TaxID=7936 RepID=A0A0E9XPV9_ANGAN
MIIYKGSNIHIMKSQRVQKTTNITSVSKGVYNKLKGGQGVPVMCNRTSRHK